MIEAEKKLAELQRTKLAAQKRHSEALAALEAAPKREGS
jgi:SAM-dependent MidA family methyltransferase